MTFHVFEGRVPSGWTLGAPLKGARRQLTTPTTRDYRKWDGTQGPPWRRRVTVDSRLVVVVRLAFLPVAHIGNLYAGYKVWQLVSSMSGHQILNERRNGGNQKGGSGKPRRGGKELACTLFMPLAKSVGLSSLQAIEVNSASPTYQPLLGSICKCTLENVKYAEINLKWYSSFPAINGPFSILADCPGQTNGYRKIVHSACFSVEEGCKLYWRHATYQLFTAIIISSSKQQHIYLKFSSTVLAYCITVWLFHGYNPAVKKLKEHFIINFSIVYQFTDRLMLNVGKLASHFFSVSSGSYFGFKIIQNSQVFTKGKKRRVHKRE